MSKFVKILLIIYCLITGLIGQEVSVVGGFLPYETYYISSIDIATGESNIQLFDYIISSSEQSPYQPSIKFHVQFKIEVFSPELGFSERKTIFDIITKNRISMIHPIRLDNRDFSINSSQLVDVNGNNVKDENGNNIGFKIGESISLDKSSSVFSSIITMGRLPDGIYDFTLILSDFSTGQSDIITNQSVNITTPTSLNLIFPGGALMDTAQNLVYTPYPVFQWSTETCFTCDLFIRVAEFNPELHSSLAEAVEDVTSFPVDQIKGWEMIAAGTSFQYPVIGARELQPGKIYAWQIKKELLTTIGTEHYLSTISTFKLADPSASQNINTTTEVEAQALTDPVTDPILITLKDFLGKENYETYFGADGEFASYLLSGTFQINNEDATSKDILQIFGQLQKGTISVVNISVE